MNVSLGVMYGLVGLFGWGLADFLARLAMERENYFRTLLFSQALGAVILFIYSYWFLGIPMFSLETAVLAAFLGGLWCFSYLAFYKSIEVGKLAVVSPVGASWAIIAVLFGVTMFSEKLTMIRILGVVLSIIGVILASTSFSDLRNIGKGFKLLKGVKYALFAMFGWGIMFPLVNTQLSELGPIIPILALKVFAVLYLLMTAGVKGWSLSLSSRKAVMIIIAIGVIDVLAFLGYTHGLQTEFVSIVSPTVAAFPALTVILARYFLKEKLEINQKIGLPLVILGLVLMAVVF